MLRPIKVTPIENVKELNDGTFELIDPDDIGYLQHVHVQAMPQKKKSEDGSVEETGKVNFMLRCLVLWENHRNLATGWVDPAKLHWVDCEDQNYFDSLDEEEFEGQAAEGEGEGEEARL